MHLTNSLDTITNLYERKIKKLNFTMSPLLTKYRLGNSIDWVFLVLSSGDLLKIENNGGEIYISEGTTPF